MKNNKTLRKSIIKSLITGQASEHCLTDLSSFELADAIRKEQSHLLSKKILRKQKNDNHLTYKDGKYKEALKKAKEMNAEKVLKATQEYRKDIKDKTNK